MRNAIWLAAVVVLATAIAAQSAELKITGPVGPVPAGAFLQLPVEGITPAQLPGADVSCWPTASVTLAPAQPWKKDGKPYVGFIARNPGVYAIRVTVAIETNQLAIAECWIQVGEAPDPGPDPPDPDPDPNPDAKWQVMFFQESDDLDNYTQGQRIILAGRKFREELEAKGHTFLGAYDRSAVPKAFVEGANLQPWWNAVKGDPLPRFAIAPVNGGPVQDFPLPKTVAEFYKALEAIR